MFRLSTLVLLSAVLSIAVIDYAAKAQTDTSGLLIRRIGLTRIARVSPGGQVADTLYESNAIDVFDLTVAPSGRFVGALEGIDQSKRSNRLIVLDGAGRVARIVDRDVKKYVWCCTGNQIAAVTGTYEEARGFTPSGVYLVDVDRQVETPLSVPGVYEVAWAEFDRALYFKVAAPVGARSVVRYDPRTRETRVTEYRDLWFSPSGAFYLHYFPDPTLGPPGVHIFERATGREVPTPDPSLGAIEDWVFAEGDFLRLKQTSYPHRQGMRRGAEVVLGYTIYDVRLGTVAGRIQDSIRTDIVGPGRAIALPANGGIRLVRTPRELTPR